MNVPRRRFPAIALGVLCLLFTTCSENPLSHPKDSEPDLRLLGLWKGSMVSASGASETEETHYYVVPAGRKATPSLYYLLDVDRSASCVIRHGPGPNSPGDSEACSMSGDMPNFVFPTKIGKDSFLNIAVSYSSVERGLRRPWKDVATDHNTQFVIWKYAVSGNRLRVWPMDPSRIAAAVQSKRIQGKLGGRGPAKICEPPEAILQFLKEEGDRLFDTNPHEFVRVPKEDGRYKVSERVRLGISKVDTFVAERSATGNEATD